jgi:nucleotide-binding universal stress UspA family protein
MDDVDATSAAPVIVGIDGSVESKKALRWAAEYARMSRAPLQALIAWNVPVSYGMPVIYDDVDLESQARTTLAQTVADVLGDSTDVTLRAEQGHPAAALVAASSDARLLVLGSHGHGGFAASLLGSVSQHCIHHAHCPVVVVRGESDT